MNVNWRRIGRMIYVPTIAGLALMLAAVVFLLFISHPQINGYYRAMFVDIIYGHAFRPFVTRALLPVLVRIIAFSLPTEWKAAIVAADWRLAYSWEQEYLPEYLVASVLMYASLAGFFFALKYFIEGLYELPRIFIDAVCLVALASLPAFFQYYSYVYDFPTLCLFTLGLGLLLRRKWTQFIVLFFLATVNKETSILLVLIFAIYFFRRNELLDPKKFRQILISQIFIYLVVRGGIAWIFRNNPGSLVEFHLLDHNLGLFHQHPSLAGIVIALTLLALVFYKWMEKPAFVRFGFWIVWIALFVAALFFGFLEEYRDYYEAYPLFVALAIHSLARVMRLPVQVVSVNSL